MQPREPTSTAKWAEENLKLPLEVGAFQRDFDLRYGPHLYGILAAMDDPKIHEIYCMKAAQVLWTTVLIAYIFHRIETTGGVILGMFASDTAAKKFGRTKLETMGKATKPIAKKINFSGSTRSGNSQTHKVFDGGFLEIFGSNSASNVKTTTANLVFVEEPDDANENVGSQGDSIKLLFERVKRVRNPKKILGGTPSVKGFSRVSEHIALSDMRVLPIACHDCGEKHVLDFQNVKGWQCDTGVCEPHPIFGYNKPENAFYACPHCGSVWDDYQRKENIHNTVMQAIEDGDPYFGWVPTRPEKTGVAGFTCLMELYSCLPGAGQAQLVRDYLEAEYYEARGDSTKKIVFINSKLGREYEYEDGRDNAEQLAKLAESDPESQRPEKLCPQLGLIITIGIDTQPDRLAIVIRAHGKNRQSWLLFAEEIYAKGKTGNELDPVWSQLDEIVFAPFEHESGRSLYASAITIDSGGHSTQAVYDWVITRSKKYPAVKIMAGKGSSSRANPAVFVRPPVGKSLEVKNPDKLTLAEKKGVKLFIIGTIQAKDYLAERLGEFSRGEGRFHFYRKADMRDDYFEHMVAESKIPDKSGRKIWKQKSGCPCEFWDCEVYAEHAARALGIHHRDASYWDDLHSKIMQSDLFTKAIPMQEAASDPGYTVKPSNYKRRN